MQKLFDEVGSLDERCYDKFALSEEILMEHAAEGMAAFIRRKFTLGSTVLVVCGSGNNGADGLALSRLLFKDYEVQIFSLKESKSEMAKLQDKRAHCIHVKRTIELNEADVIVDAIFGTGFSGKLDSEAKSVLQTLNKLNAYKIACDIPSGIHKNGVCDKNSFIADTTLTMGALKKSLFNDQAKEYVGNIKVLDLGLSREIYETDSNWNLLCFDDMDLPFRHGKDTHKGTYGHLAISSGEKMGASVIAALSALNFGTGLVTLLSQEEQTSSTIPFELMLSKSLPSNTSALALGMGLGISSDIETLKAYLNNTLPLIIDADIFSMPIVLEILKRKKLVITPHPLEFVRLLELTGLADISVNELQNHRFHYAELFSQKYPDVVLLLKGANVIIAQRGKYFINSNGTSALAKGGSGDVLSGLIGSLLAQGYEPLNATITASLAHTQIALNYTGSDFSLTPNDLIKGIGKL